MKFYGQLDTFYKINKRLNKTKANKLDLSNEKTQCNTNTNIEEKNSLEVKYELLTRKELIAIAKENNIEKYSKLNKNKLIKLLRGGK